LTSLLHDVRLIARLLTKSPAYALATTLTLALAIGANSAIFSAVYGVLLKPLPIHDPSRLVVSWEIDQTHHLPVVELTYRAIDDISRETRSFSHVAAVGSTTWPAWLKGRGAAERISIAGVSALFFDTLGAAPALGRGLTAADDVPNAPRVLVLSYAMWMSRFGGDPSIVGTRINLDDGLHTIVGVMPRGFDVPRGAQLWTPVVPILASSSPQALDSVGVLYMVARLRPGVTRDAARDESCQAAGIEVRRLRPYASAPSSRSTRRRIASDEAYVESIP